ncbi:MAG: MATE family efflux transporter [bacterium]|nr:MATE family efflux transporter [bacterium]
MHFKTEPLNEGSISSVFKLAWPLIIGMLSFTIMDVTDTLMVGQLGKSELAGVGIATTVIFFINSFFLGFFESVKILVAQATGAKQELTAKQAAWQGIFLSVFCSLVIVFISFFGSSIFAIFGGPKHLQVIANDYFSIRVYASFFWFTVMCIDGYFQGIGNTKLPMFINILMCVLNIIFCQIFIFGLGPIPKMGVAGSAYATILSTLIALFIAAYYFLREARIPLTWFSSVSNKLINLGYPMGVRWLLDTSGWTLIVAMIAHIGENEIAANQIATRIMCLSILPVYGLSEAASILTGQCTGAQNMKVLYRSYWSVMKIAFMIMGLFAALFSFIPTWVVSHFQTDQEVIRLASELLLMVGIFQMLVAFSMTTAGALNGTGDTKFTMFFSISSTWLFAVPLGYALGFVFNFGMFGMWSALILQELLLAIGYQWRFHSQKWMNHSMVKNI